MNLVRRAAFDHFWQSLAKSRKPLPQKFVEPIRARLEAALLSSPDLIVEKVHYTSHPDSLMEVVCTWVGVDAHPEAAETALKLIWSEKIIEAEQEMLTFDPHSELFYLRFAGQMPEKRFLTGRILVRL